MYGEVRFAIHRSSSDVRTAICLRDNGILLQHAAHFNKEPPIESFNYEFDPCDRPITFHHLLTDQLHRLYLISKESKQGILTYGEVYRHFSVQFNQDDLQFNKTRKGSDYIHFKVEDPSACRKACVNEPKCMSFDFLDSICYLKNGVPAPSPRNNTVSGVLHSRYICNRTQISD